MYLRAAFIQKEISQRKQEAKNYWKYPFNIAVKLKFI